ncbi:hypothetical protein J6590_034448 [Homalodisca vitripennis]|nr:hypothetical protein J6590_034448 [Homalodisca vitripennis]
MPDLLRLRTNGSRTRQAIAVKNVCIAYLSCDFGMTNAPVTDLLRLRTNGSRTRQAIAVKNVCIAYLSCDFGKKKCSSYRFGFQLTFLGKLRGRDMPDLLRLRTNGSRTRQAIAVKNGRDMPELLRLRTNGSRTRQAMAVKNWLKRDMPELLGLLGKYR